MLDCTKSGSGSDSGGSGGGTCRLPEDEWLQLRRLRGGGGAKGKRYFVAFNLHNNAALMPHFLTELTKFLSFFDLEGGQVFVSAFESGSSDMTPAWLDLFDQVLDAYKVPHRVLFGDYDLRLQNRNQHRIEFLAHMRNKALEPLGVMDQQGLWRCHEVRMDLVKDSLGSLFGLKGGQEVERLAHNLGRVAKDEETGAPAVFDQIVFINDIFFCVRDILHLMEHGADLACGLDFFPPSETNSVPCTKDVAAYYDIWVGRDIQGKRIHHCPPYINGETLPHLAETMAQGLPVPVQCCWNGMVVMNAEPFHRGLRFRHMDVKPSQRRYYTTFGKAEVPKECSASECSLLCRDLWANNYTKVIMDPSVKVLYQEDKDYFYKSREEIWPVIDYAVRNRGLEEGRVPFVSGAKDAAGDTGIGGWPPPEAVECCPMKTNQGFVGDILFGRDGTCYNESVSDPTYLQDTSKLLGPAPP